jgi:hypothetical protein
VVIAVAVGLGVTLDVWLALVSALDVSMDDDGLDTDDVVGLADVDEVVADDVTDELAATTANCATPTRRDSDPTACSTCTPGVTEAGTTNSIRTVPEPSAVTGGSEIGSENKVTATLSPGVKPLNTTT